MARYLFATLLALTVLSAPHYADAHVKGVGKGTHVSPSKGSGDATHGTVSEGKANGKGPRTSDGKPRSAIKAHVEASTTGKQLAPVQRTGVKRVIAVEASPAEVSKMLDKLDARTTQKGVGARLDAKLQDVSPRSVKDVASDLAKDIGRNRVSGNTAGGQRIDIDLDARTRGGADGGHFSKTLDQDIETPHVHTADINTGPNGQKNLSNRQVRPATMNDVRTARKLAEQQK